VLAPSRASASAASHLLCVSMLSMLCCMLGRFCIVFSLCSDLAEAAPPPAPPFRQVVVHNLPWDCTWQQLKDAFTACGEIERADVVFDSRGRSR
jgi:hypothetical protein